MPRCKATPRIVTQFLFTCSHCCLLANVQHGLGLLAREEETLLECVATNNAAADSDSRQASLECLLRISQSDYYSNASAVGKFLMASEGHFLSTQRGAYLLSNSIHEIGVF